MSSKPVIVVTGATGLQGGSVAKALLKDGSFTVRITTRNPDSPRAKDLAAQGVEVVQCDFSDLQDLRKAFKGAYGVFGMTNYWDPTTGGAEGEVKQGKLLVDAAKAEGVKHFVWSTLDYVKNPPVVHFNSKNTVDKYLKASGVPHTSFFNVFFMENFVNSFPFAKNPDGSYEVNWPMLWTDGKLWVYQAADTGIFVLEAFKKPNEWLGKDMRIIQDVITTREFIRLLQEESGKTIKYNEVSREAFDGVKDVPQLADLWANMTFFYDNDPYTHRDITLTKKIHPNALTVRQWVKANVKAMLKE